jgi:hypothetical protein
MRTLASLALAAILATTVAVSQEGPEADALVDCLFANGQARLAAGADVDTAFEQSWAACDEVAAKVPVEHDGVDFDGLEGIDEMFFHWLLDLHEKGFARA